MKAPDFTNPDFAGAGLKWGRWAVIAIAGLIVISGCFTTVAAGYVGIPVTFGEVGNSVWNPGLHMKMPFITSVVAMPTRLEKHPVTATAASKDLQQVTAEVTVPFSLRADSAPGVYQTLGSRETFESTIIDPGVMESVKAVTAQFTAEELVTQREKVKALIEDQIKSYIRVALAEKKLPARSTWATWPSPISISRRTSTTRSSKRSRPSRTLCARKTRSVRR